MARLRAGSQDPFCAPLQKMLKYSMYYEKVHQEQINRKTNMLNFLDKIPYSILIIAAIFMLLAPFRPMPHVVEKLIMLKNGTLTKPIDVFDLFYHLIPTFILILKILRNFKK
jgi:hypothetical protein